MLSLRLVSVLICVVLTLVTAALTLAVTLSFTQKAVDELGLRFSSSLAANLKHQVQEHLQGAANQYLGMSVAPELSATGPPNTTWTPGWNGSFWTYNPADLAQVDGYYKMLATALTAHNFTRESAAQICFVDGTLLYISTAPASYYPAHFYTQTFVGRGPALTTPAFPTFTYQRAWSKARQTVLSSPTVVTHPTPWSMPTCPLTQACATLECRVRPAFTGGNAYGKGRCWWITPYISTSPSAVTGVSCTMYNSANQRLGIAGSIMTLDAVSTFVRSVERTANGHAFAVDSVNWGLLGSSYPQGFQLAWRWGNATYNAATNTFQNSSSVFPITLVPVLDNTQRFSDVAAVSANATHVVVKPACLVGTLSAYVVCQNTVSDYGYEPLLSLHSQVGLDPSQGFRQGILTAGDGRFYYALDGIATYANDYLLPGLLWTVVILTPERDVMAKVVAGRTYSIVATVLFFVFAAGCCFVLFTIFLSPLAELEDKMLMTANLADENDKDEPLSSLSEVRSMQKSFYKLRAQLRRLKSFVPQSVLAALDDGDDDEEETSLAAGQHSSTGVEDLESGRYQSQTAKSPRSETASKRPEDMSSHTPSSKGSKGTKKSSGHYTVSSGGQAVRLLNMQVGMVKRVISVLVFNVVGVHAQLRTMLAEEFVRVHSRLVEQFHAIVTQEKGIVDSFQGDRFVATFNAVTNNAQHAVRACVAGQQLAAMLAKVKAPFARAGVGIASGEALVGNAGAEALRRFCTVGRVYTQATAMERFTKQQTTADVIVSSGTASQVRHEFYFEALDAVAFEGGSRPVLVFALRARMNHAMEEWNYAMLQNEAKDRYGALNEAFAKYVDGDPTASRALLSSVAEADRELGGYSRLSALLQLPGAPMECVAGVQGRFFAASFGPQ